MFDVAVAVSRRGSASFQKRLPATCSAILAIGSSCGSCVFTAFSCPRVVMVTVKCWSRTRLLIICTASPRGSTRLQRTASLPMARSGMLSTGQPASMRLTHHNFESVRRTLFTIKFAATLARVGDIDSDGDIASEHLGRRAHREPWTDDGRLRLRSICRGSLWRGRGGVLA